MNTVAFMNITRASSPIFDENNEKYTKFSSKRLIKIYTILEGQLSTPITKEGDNSLTRENNDLDFVFKTPHGYFNEILRTYNEMQRQ